MDVSSIASAAVGMTTANTNMKLQVALLKQVMDMQAQSTAILMDAATSSSNLPAHLGQNINTTA